MALENPISCKVLKYFNLNHYLAVIFALSDSFSEKTQEEKRQLMREG
jgi:hypothetical protein